MFIIYMAGMEFNELHVAPQHSYCLGYKRWVLKDETNLQFRWSLWMGFFGDLFFSEMSMFSFLYASSKVGCTDEL